MNILEEFSSNNEEDSEEDSEEDYQIEENNIKCKNEQIILDKDAESIFTLSKKIEIQNNKKIQFIKQMFNYLLKNFTFTETLIIHSIYNHNVKCFLIRNKTFKEYVLIMTILNHFYIKFTKNILNNIFDNIPLHETSKKFIKLSEEINTNFNFTDFIKTYSYEDENLKYIPKLIKHYVNGFLFYLKNMLILHHNNKNFIQLYNISKSDINDILNILLKDKNTSFCNDENLKLLSTWISYIIKKLLIYNLTCINNNYTNTINIKKSFETQIQILLNIFVYLIIIYNSPLILNKENFDKKKIEKFLLFQFSNKDIIISFITHKKLNIILKHLYENNLKKNIFSSRKFIRILYKNLI
jgi:hypothetical protein